MLSLILQEVFSVEKIAKYFTQNHIFEKPQLDSCKLFLKNSISFQNYKLVYRV